MIVPVEILQKLKCSNCEDILSCGPVLFKQDGNNICGRCSNLEETALPNNAYNELAGMCAFPCKYEAEGCPEKVPFSLIKEHEENCEFHSYICPVMPSGSCDWIGPRMKILEHTKEEHSEKILQHPCEMVHDVKSASIKTFLTTAFDLLFLIHVKICLKTYTVYHCIRKIGETNSCQTFQFNLTIETENGILIRKGKVAPQGCFALQEHVSIAVKINAMMEALSGFNDSKFIITLQEIMKCYNCKKNRSNNEIYDKINNFYYCSSCSSSLISCSNSAEGCLWRGTLDLTANHELLCPFKKCCGVCNYNQKLRELTSKNEEYKPRLMKRYRDRNPVLFEGYSWRQADSEDYQDDRSETRSKSFMRRPGDIKREDDSRGGYRRNKDRSGRDNEENNDDSSNFRGSNGELWRKKI